ncbi:hypothetical protein FRC02_003237 [Tulasnella sp. 418]|nr:hypothetical protein FRC02_003237 [Tulasnella sp. 418]
MPRKLSLSSLAALILIPPIAALGDYSAFPEACASQCQQFVKNSALCAEQHPASSPAGSRDFSACFCSSIDSANVESCASCLDAYSTPEVAAMARNSTSTCEMMAQGCTYQCSFTLCDPQDVACQCTKEYLQNVYDCGSCGTNNNITGGTLLKDYQELAASCQAQKMAGPNDLAKSTRPVPSPTSETDFAQPTLTGAIVTTGAIATSTPLPDSAASSVPTSSRTTASSSSSTRASALPLTTGKSPAETTSVSASGAQKVLNSGLGGIGVAIVVALAVL